jgi:argininosuccinate lyase
VSLWEGRLSAEPDDTMWRFTVDRADRRLLAVDIEGSLAHVKMLGEAGLLTVEETETIVSGLETILEEAESNAFRFSPGDEDVHTAVERRLGEIVGPVAGKLHTGRSRNDQIALDLRLYLLRNSKRRVAQVEMMIGVLVDLAERHTDTIVPMFTHLQQAQAVPLAQHLLAYAWMLDRDAGRFADVMRRLEESPLGAGAGGGSSLPLEPGLVAETLGMRTVFSNSMDAVGARDAVAEYVFCAAQTMVDLSRLAEEMVLWATSEFGWVTFPDAYTTGSSALPQKKNPDVAELVRGRSARAIGDVASMLTLQKGLPLAYNRDLQEDKRVVFDADDVLEGALEALPGMLASADFHPPGPSVWVVALDLAEVLVERGVPFREAHAAIGRFVAGLVEEGRDFSTVTPGELETAHVQLIPEDLGLLDPIGSAKRRTLDIDGQVARLRERHASVG